MHNAPAENANRMRPAVTLLHRPRCLVVKSVALFFYTAQSVRQPVLRKCHVIFARAHLVIKDVAFAVL